MTLVPLTLLGALHLFPMRQVQTFDLEDSKGVNAIIVRSEEGLEPFVGIAKTIHGSLTFDPAHPDQTKGKVVVDVAGFDLSMGPMSDAMKGGWCMDAKGHPTIELSLLSVRNVRQKGSSLEALAEADFTVKGVTKRISIPVKADYYPGKLGDRNGGEQPGDLLKIRTHFTIKRLEYGVGKSLGTAMCGDDLQITANIVGRCIKPKKG